MCRTLLFKILFLLFFIKSTGQEKDIKKLGIGFLHSNTENPLPLYKNQNDNIPIDILKFKKDESGVLQFVTNLKLKPYIIFEGDSYEDSKKHVYKHFPQLVFRVVDSSKQYFKVILNEVSGEEAFIKRDKKSVYYLKQKDFVGYSNSNYNSKWFVFETWETILLNAISIVSDKLIIYDKPNGKVIYKQVNNTDYLPFIVSEYKGDWIKFVKLPGREFFFDKNVNYDGWVKWKENEVITISFNSISYLSTEEKK
ncbi:hypothetical protein ACHRVZ_08120 [Flavobacterium sp. FlaQc-57]|uniref:hypothetical protein n=1 Tax=Flavobacterium sp. FlaQc-57 TaxID=3374186 RepID=UPI003757CE6B